MDLHDKVYTYHESKDTAGYTHDYVTTHTDMVKDFTAKTTKFEADLAVYPDPWKADIPVYYASYKQQFDWCFNWKIEDG